ncbi:MAG: bifunctional demethylmenaquinone methyltransferase/2-methoxy-6-polyprenyl-1,4-benzoquinol methylase UbiE [Deferribacteraceae bacterium]|jgi:demethylmenaquinone methyltransferase/2-methoxy-6-polyprenyl-1,4-benzoquinol methylase|nr:bifunctional demethylmenaquinone methyltransferase/2-methoxy-6-polyprenyl-1,4-benzoquinol methylase UbiE [Deferribacteraceae bacterium]
MNIREMFDDISPAYDLLNHLLSFGRDKKWRKRAVYTLEVKENDFLLDIACGTGDMLLAVKAISPLTFTVGIDFSLNMLHAAQKKGLPSQLAAADACALPFNSNYFNKITMAFGFRNIPDKPRVLSEAYRVLKPGGVLGILEFSKPENTLFSVLYWFYFKYILPSAGAVISGHREAYRYLPESVTSFPNNDDYLDMVRSAEFSNVILTPYDFGICSLLTAEKVICP